MTNSARVSGRPSSSAAYNVTDVVDTPDSAIKSWRYLGAGEWEPNDAVRYTRGPGGGIGDDPQHPANLVISTGETLRPYNRALLDQAVRARKVGRLGVGSAGVVALRFDDWQEDLYSTIYPLYRARALPFSIALISRWEEQPWADSTTVAQIQEMCSNGGEIWSHGLDHKDYVGYTGLYDNIVVSKAEIEARINTRCQGFSIPGVTAINSAALRGSDKPYYGLFEADPMNWYSPAGRLIMDHYEQGEAYSGAAFMHVGEQGPLFGRSHQTVSDGVTLETAMSWITTCKVKKQSVRVMTHSGNVGKPGNISLEDYTVWLDAIVTAREAGEIEVVTPSSLNFVTSDNSRLDIMYGQGALLGISSASPGLWNLIDTGTSNTVYATGGYDNGPYVEVPESGGNGPNMRPTLGNTMVGESYMFIGRAQSGGPSTTGARVIIKSYPDAGALTVDRTFTGVGTSGWTTIRVPFTIPMRHANGGPLTQLLVQVTRGSGSACRWSDMRIVKL